MGSTRPNVAQGYELEVIAMVVLGGVSTSGGKGKLAGPLLAVFIIGFLNYGLGLVNIQAQILLIIVGSLLILSVLVLNIRFGDGHKRPAPSAVMSAADEKQPDEKQ
jgi:rhamnose transport system permease protein